MIVILGPTACGKTSLAAYTAAKLNTGIISADSRQVYRGMDIGTGKDLADYTLDGKEIPVSLIDVAEPSEEFNLHSYLKMFKDVYSDYRRLNKEPVLCGGTGLYIEAVIGGYNLVDVPENPELRKQYDRMELQELVALLQSFGPLHATTDSLDRQRTYRALEVAEYRKSQGLSERINPYPHRAIFGIHFEREIVRNRITDRLKERLNNGMIEEVNYLLDMGVTKKRLLQFGLEYKFITQYLSSEIQYDEMFNKLNIAIHQFSKRQMTWFRKMERSGYQIHWIDGELSTEEKFNEIQKTLNKTS